MTVTNKQSFWEHLDVLRVAIVKIALVTVVFGVAAFFFKEELFSVVLAPKSDGFITYRLFNRIAAWSGSLSESFSVQLINTKLAQQFIIHLKTALCAGVLWASPYILYQLFRFVLPALYENERQYVTKIAGHENKEIRVQHVSGKLLYTIGRDKGSGYHRRRLFLRRREAGIEEIYR